MFTGPSISKHIVSSKQLFLVYNLPLLTIFGIRREDGDDLWTEDSPNEGVKEWGGGGGDLIEILRQLMFQASKLTYKRKGFVNKWQNTHGLHFNVYPTTVNSVDNCRRYECS